MAPGTLEIRVRQEPYLVFAANAFALLDLRALYFLPPQRLGLRVLDDVLAMEAKRSSADIRRLHTGETVELWPDDAGPSEQPRTTVAAGHQAEAAVAAARTSTFRCAAPGAAAR